MALAHAYLRSLRIAPRKVRIVANMIKGMETEAARIQLQHLAKHSAGPLLKLLKSATANAHHNAKIASGTPLFISDLRVDEGGVYKSSMPRARGRATPTKKRKSHILLVLETPE